MKVIKKSPTDLSRKEVEDIIISSSYLEFLSTWNSIRVVWWFYFNFEKARYFAFKIKYGMWTGLAFKETVENFKTSKKK